MKKLLKIFWFFTKLGLFFLFLGVAALYITYKVMEKDLPSVESIREYKLQVPLRIYSKDGQLIRVFGSKRRSPISISEVPDHVKYAYIAGEDANFYNHYGIDPKGLLRAVWEVITTGSKKTGGSTITMQLTRNVYLSLERTYTRKLKEIFLAIKLEQTISKDEILELYLNKIFLGHRSYGIVAAADMYYGKELDQLTLAESAMLAAPPKAPSRINPITSPERAKQRRDYVLGRMLDLGYVNQEEYEQAIEELDQAKIHEPAIELNAPWVAEMVRAKLLGMYGDAIYTDGYVVTTTLDSKMQSTAEKSVQKGLMAYDKRHGYRGPVKKIAIQNEGNIDEDLLKEGINQINKLPAVAGLQNALVINVENEYLIAKLGDGQDIEISLESSKWAAPYKDHNYIGDKPKRMSQLASIGDVIVVKRNVEGDFVLSQIPKVEGALISLNPNTGAINSLIGGFSFGLSKFNRVTQAKRQPGSGFKPILYSGALDNGLTASTLVNDAPIVFDDDKLEKAWRPQNYSEKIYGPTRLREGIVHSRNLVSIRVLDMIGIDNGRNHMLKFGFDPNDIPRNLSISLGSPNVPPLSMARAYSVFANGGYLVDPYVIETIENQKGELLYQSPKVVLCDHCEPKIEEIDSPEEIEIVINEVEKEQDAIEELEQFTVYPKRVISEENQFIVSSFMRDVVKRGTGAKALALGRKDLAGKTGTSNEQRDAWFNGYQKNNVTQVWVGFDTPAPLGRGETGGRAALPIWIDFMKVALANEPEHSLDVPAGIITAEINKETGLLAVNESSPRILEYFIPGSLPEEESSTYQSEDLEQEIEDDLFE